MPDIPAWVSVYPAENPDAILGKLPMSPGTVGYKIPTSVVPSYATGILVFVWCAITGKNVGAGYWHTAVNIPDGAQNFFSMMVVASAQGESATTFNSQAFWLPMPTDGNLSVTLAGAKFPDPGNAGDVEIHGYMLGSARG